MLQRRILDTIAGSDAAFAVVAPHLAHLFAGFKPDREQLSQLVCKCLPAAVKRQDAEELEWLASVTGDSGSPASDAPSECVKTSLDALQQVSGQSEAVERLSHWLGAAVESGAVE